MQRVQNASSTVTTSRGRVWFGSVLVGLSLCCSCGAVAEASDGTATDTAVPLQQGAHSAQPKLEQKVDVSQDISRAYMNCLIEVDRTMAELSVKANTKAVRAEAESQKAFCANRKKDCKEAPTSAGCRVFLEEFKESIQLTE